MIPTLSFLVHAAFSASPSPQRISHSSTSSSEAFLMIVLPLALTILTAGSSSSVHRSKSARFNPQLDPTLNSIQRGNGVKRRGLTSFTIHFIAVLGLDRGVSFYDLSHFSLWTTGPPFPRNGISLCDFFRHWIDSMMRWRGLSGRQKSEKKVESWLEKASLTSRRDAYVILIDFPNFSYSPRLWRVVESCTARSDSIELSGIFSNNFEQPFSKNLVKSFLCFIPIRMFARTLALQSKKAVKRTVVQPTLFGPFANFLTKFDFPSFGLKEDGVSSLWCERRVALIRVGLGSIVRRDCTSRN